MEQKIETESNPEHTTITVAYGDGIGPEIMDATLKILRYAKAKINVETIEVGEKFYTKGISSGIMPSSWETLKNNTVLLKAPITTPQGGGFKSLNVTMRKTLGLFANVRPCKAFDPYIKSDHPNMDLVIIRENEEDLYSGIEYRPSHDQFHCLKVITKTGSEKIIRYAFEYAIANNRKKVTCFSKDNIMKMSDGAFHKIFDTVAKEYPSIQADHMIVDIGSARIASQPEKFDVIVTENLYGDIVSDIAAEVCGSVGLAGSSNIGTKYAMFEAIHGSAPDIAGKNIANPSGLLSAAIMMLLHIGQKDVAAKINNAWLRTLEDGIHTADIYNENTSTKKVGTSEFAQAVIERLGKAPTKCAEIKFGEAKMNMEKINAIEINRSEKRELVGVDVYARIANDCDQLIDQICSIQHNLKLQSCALRGLKVWPNPETNARPSDLIALRFTTEGEKKTTMAEIIDLMSVLNNQGIDIAKCENLYSYDDKIGFTLSQGE